MDVICLLVFAFMPICLAIGMYARGRKIERLCAELTAGEALRDAVTAAEKRDEKIKELRHKLAASEDQDQDKDATIKALGAQVTASENNDKRIEALEAALAAAKWKNKPDMGIVKTIVDVLENEWQIPTGLQSPLAVVNGKWTVRGFLCYRSDRPAWYQ
ncbi:hypothetical protein BU26DRAFT_500067 [Trematosphaeria pertusa]|uniref:Uncharacterized protein n=1 Tax=Trematosphaeria pertusa TaxID=390896 RepID=A0A6A6IW37_9PLEO|nr:uncharacterized protein BU26DRAFT_500067 [Trematosphaeria pertusa]KAF2254287.1 hypothetical protein BU26DRAFT_500067 [Trematosphaeria pertusa]